MREMVGRGDESVGVDLENPTGQPEPNFDRGKLRPIQMSLIAAFPLLPFTSIRIPNRVFPSWFPKAAGSARAFRKELKSNPKDRSTSKRRTMPSTPLKPSRRSTACCPIPRRPPGRRCLYFSLSRQSAWTRCSDGFPKKAARARCSFFPSPNRRSI